jgi:hypothetical protein
VPFLKQRFQEAHSRTVMRAQPATIVTAWQNDYTGLENVYIQSRESSIQIPANWLYTISAASTTRFQAGFLTGPIDHDRTHL